MFDIIVVGAGAAGMMAAIAASQNGKRVLVLEKNEKAGLLLVRGVAMLPMPQMLKQYLTILFQIKNLCTAPFMALLTRI